VCSYRVSDRLLERVDAVTGLGAHTEEDRSGRTGQARASPEDRLEVRECAARVDAEVPLVHDDDVRDLEDPCLHELERVARAGLEHEDDAVRHRLHIDLRLSDTIDAIWKTLSKDGWLFRYRLDDGFGQPKVAFIICTFWLVEALAATGRTDDAKAVMKHVHSALSPLGLLSEDYETSNLRMWGNFPQAYSHVGLIHAAFAASPRWAEVL
jgi:hypothetical protein